jgi:hypothetical protein
MSASTCASSHNNPFYLCDCRSEMPSCESTLIKWISSSTRCWTPRAVPILFILIHTPLTRCLCSSGSTREPIHRTGSRCLGRCSLWSHRVLVRGSGGISQKQLQLYSLQVFYRAFQYMLPCMLCFHASIWKKARDFRGRYWRSKCKSLSPSVCVSLPLPLPLSLFLSLSHTLSLSLPLSHSLPLCLCLSHSLFTPL